MWCCVPFCNNSPDNVSTSPETGKEKGITFHSFPREAYLRAAWLKALGKQDSPLPELAVVCSQHFLSDDFCEMENGSSQICTGAIPSTVQVCMICLDISTKLYLVRKYKLEESLETLTGHPIHDLGNLKQTVCIRCVQRLINFKQFRDMCLRARSLMMDLVEKQDLITLEHITLINRVEHQQKCNFVTTTPGPDHCNLYIINNDEDKQTELEKNIKIHDIVVKKEHDCMSVDKDISEVNNANRSIDKFPLSNNEASESDNTVMFEIKLEPVDGNTEDAKELYESEYPVKNESISFGCKVCFEEFSQEHEYNGHMSMHIQNGDVPSDCGTSPTLEPHAAESSTYIGHKYSVEMLDYGSPSAHQNLEFSGPETHSTKDKINLAPNTSKDIYSKRESENKFVGNEQNTSRTWQSETINDSELLCPQYLEIKCFTCDFCGDMFRQKSHLVTHIKIHAELLTCKFSGCEYKCKYKSHLIMHMHTHTAQKPYACELCEYKCAHSSNLARHMKVHTRVKPFTCELCDFKFTRKCHLVSHMTRHSTEKPYSCQLCDYTCALTRQLVIHMRTHSGVKPFSCQQCEYKCVLNSQLVSHMKIHTGVKSFSCKLCEYTCARNSQLVRHIKIHTGEKRYSCELCDYKCALNSQLLSHKRTHTGEKPFSCKLCDYKCARNSQLVRHLKIHTGEKPYACDLCEYKCSLNNHLVRHMRTHTGEKPYSCVLCEYKCTRTSLLQQHMRKHTSGGL